MNDLEALRALQADAQELERIERLRDRFNVFETIGFVDQELMHSRFLGYLLDPHQNHHLGHEFLRRLFDNPFFSTSSNLRDKRLDQTSVHREWRNIDIFLTNDTLRFAVILENKIWTTEHSDQLNRYHQIVSGHYPGWQVYGIYLTPHGDTPSHQGYVALSYGAVCEMLEAILRDLGPKINADVRMSIGHYIRMVRRRILGDPEIVGLCQQMYRRHKRAFDLVFKHRPDVQAQIRPIIEDLITQSPKVGPDHSRKDNIKFVGQGWDEAPALKTATGWTSSKRILIFEIHNDTDSLSLHLYMGPGPETIRQGLLRMVRAHPEVFNEPHNVNAKWLPIFSRHLLPQWAYEDLYLRQWAYEDLYEEEREREIRKQWAAFLDNDLPTINAILKEETWIWEPVQADG